MSLGAYGSNYAPYYAPFQCPSFTTSATSIMTSIQCQPTTSVQCPPSQPQCVTSTSVGYTLLLTTSYQVTGTCCGNLQVKFDSIGLTSSPPQAYAFNVVAQTAPGLSITQLVWQFGDGTVQTVPYCCQNTVSETQYHSYSQPGQYTVTVFAFDSGGNSGSASVIVSWATPLPEYSASFIPIVVSLFAVAVGVAAVRKKH